MANAPTRSPRFILWLAYLVFSTITMGSVVEVIRDNDYNGRTPGMNWSIACSSISFVITLIIVIMHMNSVTSLLVVGTKCEGVLLMILVIFWVALVGVVTDSRQGLAVDNLGAVDNGNLYYFSWAGFVCAIVLLTSYLQDAFGINVAGELRDRSPRLSLWSAHLATAIVVMGASSNYYDSSCGIGSSSECSRTIYGIVLGAIATLFAVCIVGLKVATTKAPFLAEALVSFILVVMCGVGVALITSQKGPGAVLGNLYYFTWGSFLTAFMLFASCVDDYNSASSVPSGHDHEQIHTSDDTMGMGVPVSP